MRSSVALVYLRRFSPERGLSLRAAILSLANRLSHLLTRAARVFIFRAICLPFIPLAASRITLALWAIRCSLFELRIQRKSVSFSSVESRISGAGRLIRPVFKLLRYHSQANTRFVVSSFFSTSLNSGRLGARCFGISGDNW